MVLRGLQKEVIRPLIGYIHYEAPEEEQNFATLLEMLNSMDVREDDEEYQNPVDILFERLKEKNPNHFAVNSFLVSPSKGRETAKSHSLFLCDERNGESTIWQRKRQTDMPHSMRD